MTTYNAYQGNKKIYHIYSGSDKVYYVYKGDKLVWRDRHYDKGQTILEQSTAGNFDFNIIDDGIYEVYCIGAGGRAVYTAVYDDIGYLATGGSGGGFIGKFSLTAGTYNIQIGSAAAGGSRNSFINNVVLSGGGGDGVQRLGAGAAGAAPVLSLTPISTTLNTAGNTGRSGTGGKGGSIPPITLLGGASVYQGYGRGGGGQASEYTHSCWANDRGDYIPQDGYIKIVYLEDVAQ